MGEILFKSIIVFALTVSTVGQAEVHSEIGCSLHSAAQFPLVGLVSSGMSKSQYDAVLDRLERHYIDEVALYGAELQVLRRWNYSDVNAYADRGGWSGEKWRIIMPGGLARHPEMTPDGLALVACHELGHHIGGAPKIRRYAPWSSTEGQSDYFATLKCMRRILQNEDNVAAIANTEVPEILRSYCARQFSAANDAAICVRSIQAGMSVARVFGDLAMEMAGVRNTAAFEMMNGTEVAATSNSHPHTQCRFDTYRAGSFCQVSHQTRVSQSNPDVGTCNVSAGDTKLTVRPACWYYED